MASCGADRRVMVWDLSKIGDEQVCPWLPAPTLALALQVSWASEGTPRVAP